jgi:DNA-damage-inducible protein J
MENGMASVTIQFRTDEKTKEQATELFKKLGIDMSGAINLFLHQAVNRQAIPFSISLPHIPNAETLEAFAEIEATRGQGGLPIDEFLAEMHSWK